MNRWDLLREMCEESGVELIESPLCPPGEYWGIPRVYGIPPNPNYGRPFRSLRTHAECIMGRLI